MPGAWSPNLCSETLPWPSTTMLYVPDISFAPKPLPNQTLSGPESSMVTTFACSSIFKWIETSPTDADPARARSPGCPPQATPVLRVLKKPVTPVDVTSIEQPVGLDGEEPEEKLKLFVEPPRIHDTRPFIAYFVGVPLARAVYAPCWNVIPPQPLCAQHHAWAIASDEKLAGAPGASPARNTP